MEIQMKRRGVLAVVRDISVLVVASALLISCSNQGSTVKELSGTKLLRGTWAWDIDSNTDGSQESVDLWWEHVNERERYLVPRNGAGLAVVKDRKFENLHFSDLNKMEFTSGRMSASDAKPDIDVGTVLAVRTTEKKLGKLEVIGFDPLKSGGHDIAKYDMRLRYVLYE
jgi:hypothetical protein